MGYIVVMFIHLLYLSLIFHGHASNLAIAFPIKQKGIVSQDKLSQSCKGVGWWLLVGSLAKERRKSL